MLQKFGRSVVCVFLAVAAVVCAAGARAQVADYTDHGTSFGTYNSSALPAGGAAFASSVIENGSWVVTAWAQLNGLNAVYRFSAVEKATGTAQAPAAIGASATIPAALNTVYALGVFQPGLGFVFDTSGVAIGAAVALVYDNAGALDVFVHFLKLDSTLTPPAWVQDSARSAVNVSQSLGTAWSPSVAGLTSGDVVVTWLDQSLAGTIGGNAGLNPALPAGNPGNLTAADVYARRFTQSFIGTVAVPAPGMADSAAPASSCINLSRSQGEEAWPEAATDGVSVYVTWNTRSSIADSVAGLGANSGPLGGAFGGETCDIYLAMVQSGATGTLIAPAANAHNISESSGSDTFAFRPRIAFNAAFQQLAVVWNDLSKTGGIAGNANLKALDNGGVAEYDLFMRTYALSTAPLRAAKLTDTTTQESMTAISGFGISGWLIAWNEVLNPAIPDIRARQQAYDGNLLVASPVQAYPIQSITVGGLPPAVFVWDVSMTSNTQTHIAFTTGDTPDNLRGGQPASTAGTTDAFLARGDVTTPPSSGAAPLQITSFTVNSGNAILGNTPPATVTVNLNLHNSSSTTTFSLDTLVLTLPAGFAEQGAGPVLPMPLTSGGDQSFAIVLSVTQALLVPGQNVFTVTVTASGLAVPVTVTAVFQLGVTGSTGSIAGVGVTFVINPSAITNGTNNPLTVTLSISNGGGSDLTSLAFTGDIGTFFTPASFKNMTWSPVPATSTVVAGGVKTFTAHCTAKPSIPAGLYLPAITVTAGQGAAGGSVTATANAPLSVTASTTVGPITGGPSLKAGGGGCAVDAGSSSGSVWLWLGLGLLAAAIYQRSSCRRCRSR
jgi:hypothetical protein